MTLTPQEAIKQVVVTVELVKQNLALQQRIDTLTEHNRVLREALIKIHSMTNADLMWLEADEALYTSDTNKPKEGE